MFVAALAFVIFLSGLGRPTDPNGMPVITSVDEYKDILNQANLTFGELVVKKVDLGQSLSEQENKDLRRASRQFEELKEYDPTKMGPCFASGRIHLVLNENQMAQEEFQQAIEDAALNKDTQKADEVKRLKADCELFLATSYFNQNLFGEAIPPLDDAIKSYPKGADLRVARARARIQLKNIPGAKEDLEVAIKAQPVNGAADPNVDRAKFLLKFLNSAKGTP